MQLPVGRSMLRRPLYCTVETANSRVGSNSEFFFVIWWNRNVSGPGLELFRKISQYCIAPIEWAFLSTTVQLPATHRKVEGGERDTQLVHVNEANSCLARGYCVYCKLAQGERCLSTPPPPPFLSHSPPPMLNLCDFQLLGQKWRWPPFRGSKVLQLNSDSFCDYVRIWSEVIGHL